MRSVGRTAGARGSSRGRRRARTARRRPGARRSARCRVRRRLVASSGPPTWAPSGIGRIGRPGVSGSSGSSTSGSGSSDGSITKTPFGRRTTSCSSGRRVLDDDRLVRQPVAASNPEMTGGPRLVPRASSIAPRLDQSDRAGRPDGGRAARRPSAACTTSSPSPPRASGTRMEKTPRLERSFHSSRIDVVAAARSRAETVERVPCRAEVGHRLLERQLLRRRVGSPLRP